MNKIKARNARGWVFHLITPLINHLNLDLSYSLSIFFCRIELKINAAGHYLVHSDFCL